MTCNHVKSNITLIQGTSKNMTSLSTLKLYLQLISVVQIEIIHNIQIYYFCKIHIYLPCKYWVSNIK